MNTYIVLYRNNNTGPLEIPFSFRCSATDSDNAEEQLLDSQPDADIVWVFEGDDVDLALDNFYTQNNSI